MKARITGAARKDGPVAMHRADARHSGTYAAEGPAAKPDVKWHVKLPAPAGCLLLAGGVVLCCSSEPVEALPGEFRGFLYAYDAETGDRLWEFCQTGAPILTPAVFGDTVYVGTTEGKIYSLSLADGETRGRFEVGSGASSPMTISQGKLLFGTQDGRLQVLDANFAERKSIKLAERSLREPEFGNIWDAPAVDDGMLFVSATGTYLFAVSLKDYEVVWKLPIPYEELYMHRVSSRVSTVGNTVLFARDLQTLACVEKQTGRTKWSLQLPRPFIGDFCSDESKVYIPSQDGHVMAVELQSGDIQWRFKAGQTPGSPAVDLKRVYFGTMEGSTIHALNKDTGEQVWALELGASFVEGPVVSNSTLFLVSTRGDLYCLTDMTK